MRQESNSFSHSREESPAALVAAGCADQNSSRIRTMGSQDHETSSDQVRLDRRRRGLGACPYSGGLFRGQEEGQVGGAGPVHWALQYVQLVPQILERREGRVVPDSAVLPRGKLSAEVLIGRFF
jgi:hypothetical protein